MRILRIINTVDPRHGGPIEGIKKISVPLAERGHVNEVVCVDQPNDPWIADFPLPVHAVGPASGSYRHAPGLVPWLTEHAGEYDQVVVHGVWQYCSYGAHQALTRIGKPYYLYLHGMLDPWFNKTYPLKALKKRLYWLWGEYPVLRDARAVLFTCDEERRLARESFRPYHCREIVVSYGTAGPTGDPDTLREAFYQAYPELRSRPFFLFLSRIHEKKGCDLLLRAFADVAKRDPELALVMAGPDQTGLLPSLQALCQELGIENRVHWTGMISGEVKWGAFFAAEAFVLPSHQENFGISVVEAMAAGCPVLLSNKVNIWREIEQDGAGLIDEDTQAGTEQLLNRWLSLSCTELQAFRERARASFLKRYEIQAAADSLIHVFTTRGEGAAIV